MTLGKCFYTRWQFFFWDKSGKIPGLCIRYLATVGSFSFLGLPECMTETCLQSLPTLGLLVSSRIPFYICITLISCFLSIFCWHVEISGKDFWTQTVPISPPLPGISQKQGWTLFIANLFDQIIQQHGCWGSGEGGEGPNSHILSGLQAFISKLWQM